MTMNSALPRLCTTREAAMYLYGQSNRSTINRIYRLVSEGDLTAKKLGGTLWFPRSILEAIAEEVN